MCLLKGKQYTQRSDINARVREWGMQIWLYRLHVAFAVHTAANEGRSARRSEALGQAATRTLTGSQHLPEEAAPQESQTGVKNLVGAGPRGVRL